MKTASYYLTISVTAKGSDNILKSCSLVFLFLGATFWPGPRTWRQFFPAPPAASGRTF
ncbi:hypothetical protein DSO57_1027148 [Entomophthora muscae]|uniref:Uncharacterized protein n=1 Tax=Entomophthora muscae TaxID=34485 RepID=A0ACC2S3U2_9FUNG|nr:hypothetical protein DSO57_1027148 [Entomophthora muscae]